MSSSIPPKRTPLYNAHRAAGGRLIDFAGWEMPVQYSSIVQEHLAVRQKAGIFDISHMGEFVAAGPDSAAFLNQALSNNVERIPVGNSQYSLLLAENGGVLDDLFIYRTGQEEFLLVVNASQIDADFKTLQQRLTGRATLRNDSDSIAAVALQGPASPAVLDAWIKRDAASKIGRHAIVTQDTPCGSLRIARTGYTGEDGFEILCPSTQAERLWNGLIEAGRPHGLLPCGLGARDTLRMEVCYPLYGHELSPETSPLEAGLGKFVDFEKPAFVGKEALLKQKNAGIPRRSVGLVARPGTPPPRAGYGVFKEGRRIGQITSGSQSPCLQTGMAMALVETAAAEPGKSVDIEIRGKYVPMEIVKKPIYRKNT
ncbi:MAG: glycine cleavage system aminomethyltransferase GcvT [Verrucomicrobiae bacterium]|nr:glycine cleavage system aminomethyltransferase GcvT [Verrucomicrobiae bacterium]